MLVPLKIWVAVVLPIYADNTFTPGAKISTVEPKLEKEAFVSLLSIAPTVMTAGDEAGESFEAST